MKTSATPHLLGTQPVAKLLRRYALPSIVAMASSSLYNIIDSVFIGHGVGAAGISALSVAMPLMNIASAFGSMLGIGAASIISIRLGQHRRQTAEQTLGNVVLLTLLVAAGFSALALWRLDAVLTLFGAGEQTLPLARDFMRILLPGTVITHLYLSLNEVMRASGYPGRAMAVVLISIALNCALNPLFIFVLGWGIRGSAAATLLAQAAALALTLAHFIHPHSFLHFRRGIFRPSLRIVGGILSIGMAPFMMHLCASAVTVCVNNALSAEGGELYIGAYGIINRVTMLFLTIVSGLNQGMQPIVGYNYGARNMERVRRALGLTLLCACTVTTCGFLAARLFPEAIAGCFVSERGDADAAMLAAAAAHGLRRVLVCFPVVGFQIVTAHFFQYIGRAKLAIVLSMTRQMLFLVPLLLLLPPRYGVEGVWAAIPIADATASALAIVLLLRELPRLHDTPAGTPSATNEAVSGTNRKEKR